MAHVARASAVRGSAAARRKQVFSGWIMAAIRYGWSSRAAVWKAVGLRIVVNGDTCVRGSECRWLSTIVNTGHMRSSYILEMRAMNVHQ